MISWGGFFQTLLFPGFLSALLAGLLCRGVAAWLGAHLGRRPAPPPWQPFADLFHLGAKSPSGTGLAAARSSWPGALAVVALSWATGMLPWRVRGLPVPRELPGSLVLYLILLAAPPVARLVTAGLSGSPAAALGARRQAPVELARLLPLFLAAAALSLASRRADMSQQVAPGLLPTIVAVLVVGIFLATLPWPLWDRDERDSLLAGLGGRALVLFRMAEALELSAQMGLAAVAVQASTGLPAGREWLPAAAAATAALAVLAALERNGQRLPVTTAVRRYTRWLLPIALVLVVLGWWVGR